jgi:hypothetical protein
MSTSAKRAAPAKRTANTSKKEVVAPLSRKDIEGQVKAFLKSGGAIQSIPNGVSGQQHLLPTRKHIVIAKKKD